MSNYGFQSSTEVKYDTMGLPLGTYRVMANDEEDVPSGVKVLYEILSGKNKGQKKSVWYNTLSDNEITRNIARQALKRIGDCTDMPVSAAAPIKGRVFVVQVEESKNPSFTEIKKYLPKDHAVDADEAEIPFS